MIRIVIGIGAVVAILLTFCAVQSNTLTVDVSYDEFQSQRGTVTREIELNSWADSIEVSLSANPTTGFEWELAEVTYDAVWTPFGTKFEAPDWTPTSHEYQAPEETGLVGVGGKEIWTFPAGTGNITMVYSQPWEGGEKAEWTFNLTVFK